MPDTANWPHWEIQFDKAGNTDAGIRAALLDQITKADLTDLFVMSHGWNSTPDHARQLYGQWFGMLPPLIRTGSTARPGTLGVIWPSMLWPDEPQPTAPASDSAAAPDGGAASIPEPEAPGAPVAALTAVYTDPDQQRILSELAGMLNAQSPDPQALDRFKDLMVALSATEPKAIAPEDSGQLAMLNEDPQTLAARFAAALDDAAAQATATGGAGQELDMGGAADLPDVTLPDVGQGAVGGIGDITGRLWNGAKEALRSLTYWQMKLRAGTVGQSGLGPFISDLAAQAPNLRVHLIGHSFGARLVSFSLAGLTDPSPSPVRSLTLLEGAFSHFAFADALPEDPGRAGALKGMMKRVDGPLLACYSSHDTAVGIMYPIASMTAHDDAAGLADAVMFRWGGMGHDGAQAVNAAAVTVQPVRSPYNFAPSQFTNIDASDVVCQGGPPSGAHSDIVHPELAWAVLDAAGLT